MNDLIFSGALTKRDFHEKVDELQETLLGMVQAESKLHHEFAHGLYARQLFIPAGSAYVGKIHRFSHFRIVLKGRLLIVTDTGRYECQAPHFMITTAGTRRVGYAFTDSVIMTIHATDKTDLQEIENEIIMPREELVLS